MAPSNLMLALKRNWVVRLWASCPVCMHQAVSVGVVVAVVAEMGVGGQVVEGWPGAVEKHVVASCD